MLTLNQRTICSTANATLTLPLESRCKTRLRVKLDDGRDAGIFLPRGDFLSHGDKLLSECGEVVVIHAANERLSTAATNDAVLFARACYHLGNRHVQLQIGSGTLAYQHDHVLDEMLAALGLDVIITDLPFQPESGAYSAGHNHRHG